MFMRFVLWEPRVRPSRGLFQIAYVVRDDESVSPWVRDGVREQTDWFDDNLPVPHIYDRRATHGRRGGALCWFRSEARECVSRARELARLLEEAGSSLTLLVAKRPGCILYDDAFQVAAVPYDGTLCLA